MDHSSTPLSSPPQSQVFSRSSASALYNFRPTHPLPFELAQHVNTYYEESLFTQAYGFLLSIVSNSISPIDSNAPITIPSPGHLALAATITVHPKFTTRTTAREKWEQANAAMRLLRVVLQTAGPVEARLCEAFTFTRYYQRSDSRSPSRRRGGSASRTNNTNYDNVNDDLSQEHINTPFADDDSLWLRAEDFWHVVGWAFNCSCFSHLTDSMHAKRWEHWSRWLEFMLEALEIDWNVHARNNSTEESIIWHYVEVAGSAGSGMGSYGNVRRILRAIFADGSHKSLNEFREVFRNECKEPVEKKINGKFRKREVDVDIEAEVYGDYLDTDDSENSINDTTYKSNKRARTRTPSAHRRVTPRTSTGSLRSDHYEDDDTIVVSTSHSNAQKHNTNTLGDTQSLRLRIRLLHLLSHIAGHPDLTGGSPTTFPDLEDLYTLFIDHIKPLPFLVFQPFISPSLSTTNPNTMFSIDAHTTLCEYLLQRLLEPSAPKFREERFLTQKKMEAEYLPFAASSASSKKERNIDANARVSLLLEALLRRLNSVGALKWKKELEDAVEHGIHRRLKKCGVESDSDQNMKSGKAETKGTTGQKADGGQGDVEAMNWLVESGERMRFVVQRLSKSH